MLVVNKSKHTVSSACIYCKKKIRYKIESISSMRGRPLHSHYISHHECTDCGFVCTYNKSFESENKIHFEADDLSKRMSDRIRNARYFSDFNDINFDNRPEGRWANFIAKRFITTNSVAILNVRNKSKNISEFCWNYLKKER
jgi:hypothetical protein